MCPVSAGDNQNGDFEEFKGDIEAVERRVAREIDPGARALVIAIAVFVLLLTFVLPHTGGAKGWDVLAGNDAAIAFAKARGPAGIDKAARGYPYGSEYRAWPGPNSNTFTSWIARAVPELQVDLPSTAPRRRVGVVAS